MVLLPLLLLPLSSAFLTGPLEVSEKFSHAFANKNGSERAANTTSEFTDTVGSDVIEYVSNETDSHPRMIMNPWFRGANFHGIDKESLNLTDDRRLFPRLFADMGRGGLPPISTVMKWKWWEGVDEETKESFVAVFNGSLTKREMMERLDEWKASVNNTKLVEAIDAYLEDFAARMDLLEVNLQSALQTLQITVASFADIAHNEDLTMAESGALLNLISSMLDRNFVRSVYYLFNGDVMNGKRLKKQLEMAESSTRRPRGNSTGAGVWKGNLKRYSVHRVVGRKNSTTG